jgi:hypothetical protein
MKQEGRRVEQRPVVECSHREEEVCHYTYSTSFLPSQQQVGGLVSSSACQVCEENFEKSCQITFRQEASTETVRKCYRPQRKVCNGQGPEQCRTEYESSCTTRWAIREGGNTAQVCREPAGQAGRPHRVREVAGDAVRRGLRD